MRRRILHVGQPEAELAAGATQRLNAVLMNAACTALTTRKKSVSLPQSRWRPAAHWSL